MKRIAVIILIKKFIEIRIILTVMIAMIIMFLVIFESAVAIETEWSKYSANAAFEFL